MDFSYFQPPTSPPNNMAQQLPVRSPSSLIAKLFLGVNTEHKMDVTRKVQPISYAESEASSPSKTPQKQSDAGLEEYDEEMDEEIEYSSRRSGLRKPKVNNSLRAQENVYTTPKRPRPKKRSALEDLIGGDLTPVVSGRVAIRQEIASVTAAQRDRFLVEKKDFWLPLLPRNNYVRKLVEKHDELNDAERAKLPSITPYEEIETQPRGIVATMKPYQLSGLSFMVYLHRNVSTPFHISPLSH
jgi:SWI/SNF-related matrix-associated actin-dependent regulator of chromatin subfamily A member 5